VVSQEPEIYLDMDGVCVDFLGAAMAAQGYDPVVYLSRWHEEHPGSLFPEPLMEKTAFEFFTHENLNTSEFWAGLVPYPWFEHLFSELGRLGHVVFLTAPTGAPGCVSGKHAWLIDQFGRDFHDFIFTRHKDRLAHANAYLVDDMPFNITPFEQRGGNGILFPQTWNELSHIEEKADHVIEQLEQRINSRR
jgi:5'(3')-deoxyribonucleotidase